MDPKEALKVLDQATQPGVRLTRLDYVVVQQALEALNKLVEPVADEAAKAA
jgi:hypothetical protein